MPAAKEGAWGAVPALLLADGRISPQAVRVYAALAMRAGTKGKCHPLQPTLAADSGTARRSLTRLLGQLESAGWVTRELRREKRQSTIYSVHRAPVPRKPKQASKDKAAELKPGQKMIKVSVWAASDQICGRGLRDKLYYRLKASPALLKQAAKVYRAQICCVLDTEQPVQGKFGPEFCGRALSLESIPSSRPAEDEPQAAKTAA